jgi:hypothetical protein
MRKLLALFVFVFFAVVLPSPAREFATSSICNTMANNLVMNCGFEMGNFDFWTQAGPGGTGYPYTGVVSFGSYVPVNSGSYSAFLGPGITNVLGVPQDSTLSQTIRDIPGATYMLSFYVGNYGTCCPNNFSAQWDNLTLLTLNDVGDQPYTEYTYLGLTGTGSDTLTFTTMQQNWAFGLDDVFVIGETPEPVSMLLMGTFLSLAGGLLSKKKQAV